MKRIVLAVSIALVVSLVAGGILIGIASAAAPGGLETLSQALTSVRQAISQSSAAQAASASGARGPVLDGVAAQGDDSPTSTEEPTATEEPDDGTFKQPKECPYCDGSSETNHPEAEKLAEQYGVEYTEIIGWFCKGYGFGEISHAYEISKLTDVLVEEVFDLRASGMGWGKIKQSYGLIGKAAHPETGNGKAPGNGNGSGNGNNGQKQGGNNGDHGNGKGKGHTKP
jgi:hypothetical protein